jgi:YHS domain-containing protein
MFGKHCEICGMDVKKETATKRFGKYFCSDLHAEKFVEAQASRKQDNDSRRGGCC